MYIWANQYSKSIPAGMPLNCDWGGLKSDPIESRFGDKDFEAFDKGDGGNDEMRNDKNGATFNRDGF